MQSCRMLDSRKEAASRSRSIDRIDLWRPALAFEVTWLLVPISIIVLLLPGCSTFSRDGESGMLDISSMLKPGSIRGPLERRLYGEENPLEMGRRFSAEERKEVEAARLAYDRGDYDQSIKLCKKAAKKFKESSLGEEAQFYLAESYYAKGEYGKAQDGYDQLFEDYPSTRYIEPATRRLFAIAREWLEIVDPVAKNQIRQVSGEKVVEDKSPVKKSLDPTIRVPILPNFHSKSRPWFDTQGNALKCLKSIWMNDPTGPLADDALMLTATYYQRKQNFVEADRYFEILRDEYPNSPHIEDAFVLGAHVKQMSYQGPYYEGRDLAGAQKLKEQSLHLFPASHERPQLREDLQKIYLQQAERAWSEVEYYQKKRRPRAVAIACIQLINEYPDTSFARDARAILKSIDRSELNGLPDVKEFVSSLPAAEPKPPEPSGQGNGPVKSVSDSTGDEKRGRVVLP
jgi:outer membrane protein assembly factor BamD (BamD/ComL family)